MLTVPNLYIMALSKKNVLTAVAASTLTLYSRLRTDNVTDE